MKLTWTPDGGSGFDIGDDTSSPRKTIQIEALGGSALVQNDPLYGGDIPFLESRDNVSGRFVVRCTCSHANTDTANDYVAQEYGRIGEKGDLVWARAANLFTFADAVLESVSTAGLDGVRAALRYTFVIGAISES